MGYADSMNLYQGFNMNPVNFLDPMGEHTFKKITLFGQEIEVAQPDIDEIHRGYYSMRFSYKYKGKIHNVIIDQHIGEEWAFQAKLGNPILKPLWEALYGVSTSNIKESAFKLWSKSLAHHSPEIVMSVLGSITYMAEANAAKNAAKLAKSQNISRMAQISDDLDEALLKLYVDDIPKNYTLTKVEARQWYNAQVKNINTKLAPTRENAEYIYKIRNALRRKARDIMANREAAAFLDREYPLESFEYFIEKYTKQGYSGEELWRRIMEGGRTPNKAINKKFGIKD
jgi:hypothetical protein